MNNNDNDNNNNNNNLLLITKQTIKTYLQLISLKKKIYVFSQSTIYKSFYFISSCSFRLKNFKNNNSNNSNNNNNNNNKTFIQPA